MNLEFIMTSFGYKGCQMLFCSANQWTGFCTTTGSVMKVFNSLIVRKSESIITIEPLDYFKRFEPAFVSML